MRKSIFSIKAIWDDEAKIFFSESDIIGLNIETETLEEFVELVQEFAPELIVTNHLSKSDVTEKSLIDMIPSILCQLPFRSAGHVAA